MAMKRRQFWGGFTLIEMLVVIAIILVLSGIVMKTTAMVFRNMAIGKAQHNLHQLQNALNEYYAEYGSYPPVSELVYEFEGPTTRLNPAFRTVLGDPVYNTPDTPMFLLDTDSRGGYPSGMSGKEIGYRYGLVSYLWPRDSDILIPGTGHQLHWYDADQPRDQAFKAKVAGFLSDVALFTNGVGHTIILHAAIGYTNDTMTILDPWMHEYRYQSMPPYQTYKLWSDGPDGLNGTADDVNADVEYGR
jgi:prepilin-type N-terminal cleavage/methylation domain-containing protein